MKKNDAAVAANKAAVVEVLERYQRLAVETADLQLWEGRVREIRTAEEVADDLRWSSSKARFYLQALAADHVLTQTSRGRKAAYRLVSAEERAREAAFKADQEAAAEAVAALQRMGFNAESRYGTKLVLGAAEATRLVAMLQTGYVPEPAY